jgi:hypothetical protein
MLYKYVGLLVELQHNSDIVLPPDISRQWMFTLKPLGPSNANKSITAIKTLRIN